MLDPLDVARLIPARVALQLDAGTMRALRLRGYIPPIAGADGDDDGAGDGSGDGDGSGAGDGDGTPAAGGDDDWTPPTKEQFDAMQQSVAAANRERKKLEKQVSNANTKDKQEAGEFKELYEESTAKHEKLVGKISDTAVRGAVAEVAQKLGFLNPTVAHRLLDLAGIEADVDADTLESAVDDATKTIIERRLTELAKNEPYLAKQGGGRQIPRDDSQNPGDGGGNAGMNALIRRAAGR